MTLPPENFLYKVFGVANIYPNAGGNRKKSLVNFAYRLFFLLVLIAAFVTTFRLYYNTIITGNVVLSTKVFLEMVTYWLTGFLSYLSLFINDRKVEDVRSTLTKFEKKFEMSPGKTKWLTGCAWFEVIVLLVCQITYYIISSIKSNSSAEYAISYFFNKFTINLVSYKMTCSLWAIHHLYKEINRELLFIAKEMSSESKLWRAARSQSLSQRIYDLRFYCGEFDALSRRLSDVYSVHVWFVMVNATIENICSLTGLLFVEETCGNDPDCILLDTVTSVLWFLNFTVPVLVLVFSCNLVVTEAKRTPKLVHDIEIGSEDELLTFLLETFSLELRLNRFSFTGYRCFDVDGTLLLTIVTTVISYLIIQKQFSFDGFFTSYTGF